MASCWTRCDFLVTQPIFIYTGCVSKQLQASRLVQVVLQQPEGAKQQLCSSWQPGSYPAGPSRLEMTCST
jgi:hypothetical protein